MAPPRAGIGPAPGPSSWGDGPPPPTHPPPPTPYTELHCHSAYSFLDGAASPDQLVTEALRLGLTGLALTDHDGFYGAVQLAEAARGTAVATIYGAELSIDLPHPRQGAIDPAGQHLLVLARGQEGYRRLSRQIADAHLAGGEKGRPAYRIDDLAEAADGHWLILTGCRSGAVRRGLTSGGPVAAAAALDDLVDRFGRDNVAVELTTHLQPTDDERNDTLAAIASDKGLPVVATTAAHYARPEDSRLAAALAATRARRTLTEADGYLPPGPVAHLRSGAEMATLFARYPTAVATTVTLGNECAFDLRLVAPRLPPYPTPAGHTEASLLRELTLAGAATRYGPRSHHPAAYAQLDRELDTITALDFPGYFLVVHDIVQFCRRHDILCQGRGSAANSAVCYALGITAVDAVGYDLLFERFLSPSREGPPDIDIDIESGRREEVIQYVYTKYGRQRAALVANVNTYRKKMSVRDMARALGHDDGPGDHPHPQVAQLAARVEHLPRHLGIHPGGMVICDRPVAEVCPVEWARMADRTVLQWDKDDCAAIGLVKFDLLGLGMLSALHQALDLIREHEGIDIDLASLDLEQPEVYQMLSRADTIGVFQVESRAQMATLPRLRPERFYDLVIEIALIRPGPIQGGSVHPYLARRDALRAGTWSGPLVDHPSMQRALGKTLGIPLFQEQVMELAIDVAGFDAGQADQLRRAISSKRAVEKVAALKRLLYEGMERTHGINGALADTVYRRIEAFGGFGFAESHALSFASLVFYSAHLKLHHPAAFLAALLRSQPMGFYSPQTLVADARRHGVIVRRAHINHADAVAGLEPGPDGSPAVRLGLDGIRGIGTDLARRIVAHRPPGGYRSITALTTAMTMVPATVEALATAGALDGLPATDPAARADPAAGADPAATDRRAALWVAGSAARARPDMLPGTIDGLSAPPLPGMSRAELTVADIWATGISPDSHPVEHSRDELAAAGVITAADIHRAEPGSRILVAGMVTHRQRPSTAAGVTFLNLEDETGMVNVICSPGLWQRHRSVVGRAPALVVRGIVQRDRGAISLLADRISAFEPVVATRSRDFR